MIDSLVMLFILLIKLDVLDSSENILLKIILFDLFPSVLVVSGRSQSQLLLFLGELSVLAESVEAHDEGNSLCSEWLRLYFLPFSFFTGLLALVLVFLFF